MANPGVRLRSDEEIMDSYNSQSGKRLTTFTPGKISSKFTDRFEMKDQSGSKYGTQDRPPKKKLINADVLFKKDSEFNRRNHLHTEEINSLTSTPVKTRWRPEKTENPFINREIEQELEDVRQSRPEKTENPFINREIEQE